MSADLVLIQLIHIDTRPMIFYYGKKIFWYRGYEVAMFQASTDVDDKIINRL